MRSRRWCRLVDRHIAQDLINVDQLLIVVDVATEPQHLSRVYSPAFTKNKGVLIYVTGISFICT